MEQTDYPPMSGSNTICVATVLLETGMLPMREPETELVLEAPAGLIALRARVRNGKVTSVTFENVPAFATHLDAAARGAAASARSASTSPTAACSTSSPTPTPLGLRLTPDEGREIVRVGEMIKAAAREQMPGHRPPEQPEINALSTAQLSGPAHDRR